MCKVVYSDDPNYVPPKGVTVLPLSEHPSIKDDIEKGYSKSNDRSYPKGIEKPGFRALEIVENIRQKGYATAKELAEEFDITRQAVNLTINRHPNLIVPVGKIGRSGNETLFGISEWET